MRAIRMTFHHSPLMLSAPSSRSPRLLTLAFALLASASWSCKTGAVGVEACRKIEYTRCEAAFICGAVPDVDECKRFAHDNCLHGLGVDNQPTAGQVDGCVNALELAGKCADKYTPDVDPNRCNANVFGKSSAATVCDAVYEPERIPACGFLIGEEPEKTSKPELDKEPDAAVEPPPEEPKPEPEPEPAVDAGRQTTSSADAGSDAK